MGGKPELIGALACLVALYTYFGVLAIQDSELQTQRASLHDEVRIAADRDGIPGTSFSELVNAYRRIPRFRDRPFVEGEEFPSLSIEDMETILTSYQIE